MKSKTLFITLLLLAVLSSCREQVPMIEKGMIKVNILYPKKAGNSFNMDYYSEKHMPMVADLFGEAMRHYTIEKGIAGRTPEDPVPYAAIGTFYFDTLEAYQDAFAPHAEQILNDIPNYTDIQPVIQISKVYR